jgi:Na+/H+-dicarboxylate symporter
MRIRVPTSAASPVLWYAVLGAPAAWVTQFGISYWVTEADCSVAGERWGISTDVWVVVLTAIALAVGLTAGWVALSLFRASREADLSDDPPAGRTHFFAWVGLAVTPLFLAIIILNCIGALTQGCTQS